MQLLLHHARKLRQPLVMRLQSLLVERQVPLMQLFVQLVLTAQQS
jgi:hypothetical protein